MFQNVLSQKTCQIAFNEIKFHLQKKSFYLSVIAAPFALLSVALALSLITGNFRTPIIGVVDPDNRLNIESRSIIKNNKEEQSFIVQRLVSKKHAMNLIARNVIDAYVIVPADNAVSSEILFFERSGSSYHIRKYLIESLLSHKMSNLDKIDIKAIISPYYPDAKERYSKTKSPSPLNPGFVFTICYVLVFPFAYKRIRSSITQERANRTLEIILSSSEATQVVTGKIAGYAIVNSLHLFCWVAILSAFANSVIQPLAHLVLIALLIFFAVLGQILLASAIFLSYSDENTISRKDFVIIFFMLIICVAAFTVWQFVYSFFPINTGIRFLQIAVGAMHCLLLPFWAPLMTFVILATRDISVWECVLMFLVLSLSSILLITYSSARIKKWTFNEESRKKLSTPQSSINDCVRNAEIPV